MVLSLRLPPPTGAGFRFSVFSQMAAVGADISRADQHVVGQLALDSQVPVIDRRNLIFVDRIPNSG